MLPLVCLCFCPVWSFFAVRGVVMSLPAADVVPDGVPAAAGALVAEDAAPVTPAMLEAMEARLMERLAAAIRPPPAPGIPPGTVVPPGADAGTSSSSAAVSAGTGGESGPGFLVCWGARWV